MSNTFDNSVSNLRSPICNILRSILTDIGCKFEENENKFYVEYDYIFDCELTVFDDDGSLSLLTQLCLVNPDSEQEMLQKALQYNLDYSKTRGASIFVSADNSVFLFKTRFPALKMDYHDVSDAIARFLDNAERLGLMLAGQEDKINALSRRAVEAPEDPYLDDFVIFRP